MKASEVLRFLGALAFGLVLLKKDARKGVFALFSRTAPMQAMEKH